MTFTEAAEAVLRKAGKPLNSKKITEYAIEQNLLSHVGKTPEVTMSTRLTTLTKTDRGDEKIIRTKPGVFALREWSTQVLALTDDGDNAAEPKVSAPPPEAPAKPSEAPRGRGKPAQDRPRDSARPRRDGRRGPDTAAPPPVKAAPAANDAPSETAVVETALAHLADDGGIVASAPAEIAPPTTDVAPAAPANVAAPSADVVDASEEVTLTEVAVAPATPARVVSTEDADEPVVRSNEEIERDERLAASADMFPEEEDDEEPLLGGADKPEANKRRRRRRRGRGPDGRPEGASGPQAAGGEALATVEGGAGPLAEGSEVRVARAPEEPRRADGRREEHRRDDNRRDEPRRDDGRREEARRDDGRRDEARRDEPRDEETGRDAADLLVSMLTRRDDRQPIPLRALVDEGIRAGRLGGDPAVQVACLAAAARVDAVRREARGERPRLRLANGRVGLVDWTLPTELVRAEAEALAALERLRDTARRYVVRRLNELPQASFTEMLVLLLERIGISSLRTPRRPGLSQGEVQLAGVSRRGPEEMKVAVIVRRGGEVGRERVIELRGSLHHYGPATAAWIITTGSVLSGAREEAAQPGIAPITLVDGGMLGRLLDDNGVCVKHASVALPYLDVDLYDALRGV